MEKLNCKIPEKGELVKLEDDLYYTQFELPFRLNHVNLFFLDTHNGWVIFDCGLKSEHSHEMWEKLIDWSREYMVEDQHKLASDVDISIPTCVKSSQEAIELIRAHRKEWLES